MTQPGLDFGEQTRELVLEPDATGRCCDCGHGRLVELEDPDGRKVPGAGKWIRCALREPGHFHAPSSFCLLSPAKFWPKASP